MSEMKFTSMVYLMALIAFVASAFVYCTSATTSADNTDEDLTYVTYMPRNSTWRYSDKNMWPGNNWFDLNFDDSSWKTGRAYLATSEETEGEGVTTVLDGLTPAYMTYYFRGEFYVKDALKVARMSFNIDYDDAYAVYLNGRMIASSNLFCNWKNHFSTCTPYPHNSLIENSSSNRSFRRLI